MSSDNISLFEWKPPVKVILFPLTNRIGKIRHTAELLSRKHGEDADLYWKQVVAANRKHLTRVGLTDTEIDAEIRAFFEAVQAEIIRLSYYGHGTGGAA